MCYRYFIVCIFSRFSKIFCCVYIFVSSRIHIKEVRKTGSNIYCPPCAYLIQSSSRKMGCCLGKTENTSSKELVEKREHPDEREKKTDNSEYKLGKNDVRQSPPQEEDDVKNIIHVHSVHRKADSDDESEGSEHGDSKNEVEVENETVSTEVEVIDSENGVEDGVKGVDSKDRDSIEDIKPEQAQGAEDAPPIPPSAHVEQSTAPSTSLPPTSQPSEEPTHAQRRAVEEGLERRDSLPAPPEGYATGAGAGGGGEEGAGEVLRGESFTRQRSGSADSDSSVVSASSVFQAMARYATPTCRTTPLCCYDSVYSQV